MTNTTLEKKNSISLMTVVCTIAFFLSNISYLPMFTERGMTQILSYPAWLLLFGAILLYGQFYISKRDIKFVLFLLVAFCVLAFLEGFSGKYYFSSLLTKCFLLMMIITLAGGLVARTGKMWKQEHWMLYAYVVATVILSYVVFIQYLLGQDVSSRFYSYTSKNEAAFLCLSAVVILLALPDAKKHKNVCFAFRAALVVFLVYVAVNMRCRSMLVAMAVVAVIFLIAKSTTKRVKVLLLIGVVALVIALQNEGFYNEFVNDILLNGREKGDVNDISSGRIDQIERGWMLFQQNLFVGTGDTATVDCFYVSALMQYGLFMGGALIILGFYPLVWGLWNYRKMKSPLHTIMVVCALVYLIGGIFEENAPFGPGVRCYISWFLFGYLRVQQIHGYFGGEVNEKDRLA